MKVAIVTGSNKGIGRGIVETLSKLLDNKEWVIYLTARNIELGMKTVNELKASNMHVNFHQLDINCEKSRKDLKDYLQNQYGGLDILINNAAIAFSRDSTVPFAEQAEVTLKTNFTNTLKMCREFIPILKTNARLVNVSSTVSQMVMKKLSKELYTQFIESMSMQELEEKMQQFVNFAKEDNLEQNGWVKQAYGISKVGVTKMTYILADELRKDPRKILINSCCPGFVDTDMTNHKGHLTIYQGADTPCYLATLPIGTETPYGEFVSKREIVKWDDNDIQFFT